MMDRIDSRHFYAEYHGHLVEHLEVLLQKARESTGNVIWLAGDSSLDNKYWFNRRGPAVGIYKDILYPATSKLDVSYWLNRKCEEQGRNLIAINAAVEATTLNERTFGLRAQDKFLQENIERDDILVVSVGGNDVALCPCPCTIASILCLLSLPISCISSGRTCGTVPVDDCCCGCGPSLASCACSFPPCLGYLRHLFGTRVKKYIRKLTKKRQPPKKILVCMIYFPDEAPTPSWAGGALAALGYNTKPSKLQALIRKTFAEATSNITIPGSTVVPLPLFNVLDGQNPGDYIARVEPSPSGGEKMAELILNMIDQSDQSQRGGTLLQGASSPTTSYMGDRMN